MIAHGPSALEGIDQRLVELERNESLADEAIAELPRGQAWLLAQFSGDDQDAVDRADASALYRLLEEEVVPAFYDRDASHIQHRWLAVVKEAIRTNAARFSARRMVKEYVERMYAPALSKRGLRSEV